MSTESTVARLDEFLTMIDQYRQVLQQKVAERRAKEHDCSGQSIQQSFPVERINISEDNQCLS